MLTVKQQTSRVLYFKFRPPIPNYGGAAVQIRSEPYSVLTFLAGGSAELRILHSCAKTRNNDNYWATEYHDSY